MSDTVNHKDPDLVARLRRSMLMNVPDNQSSGICSSLPYDAADVITALLKEREELKKVLTKIAHDPRATGPQRREFAADALAALPSQQENDE